MTEKEAINYYKKAMQIHKDEFGDDQKAVDLYNTTINALQELQRYKVIGTVEEIKRMQRYSALAKKHTTIGKVIDSCAEYEDIGTVEECREAREKQIKKKPSIWGDGYDSEGKMIYDMYDCPNCGKSYEIDYSDYEYCPECGQAIDWRILK